MRALFFGTPDFAVPSLRALLEIAEVVGVFSQPDRPSGRGMKLTPPPVKVLALEHGLDVHQPTKIRTSEFAAELIALRADVALVVAYGRILPKAVLEGPRLGCLNVHGSVLPRWRGAAPIQWAIASGDSETGVTLMKMDEGMDTGDILDIQRTSIGRDETSLDLAARLSALGAELVRASVPRYVAGELTPVAQDGSLATFAPMLDKVHGHIDFRWSARQVHDRVRAMVPWPGAFTFLGGTRIKVHRTEIVFPSGQHGEPGEVVDSPSGRALHVACGEGVIALAEVQLDGRKRTHVRDFLAGHPVSRGARFDPDRAMREGSGPR